MKMININRYLLLIIVFVLLTACENDEEPNTVTDIRITSVTSDVTLNDGKNYIIDSDISKISGSIFLSGNTVLKIMNCTLNFDLTEDLQYGIYLEDNAKIIITNSTLESKDKMWEFELRGNSSIEVTDSFLKNHSAVKLFDNCTLNGKNSLIEELRMDNQGIATIDNCEIYPNMQFFFNVGSPLDFPDSYTPVNFVMDNLSLGGWKLDMTNSTAQGWQVDVKPNTDITIQNSIDVTLALWSDGTVNDSLHLVNPESTPSNFTITELGSTVNIINTEVYFINIYLKDNDKLKISGEKNADNYNTKFLEIVLMGEAELSIYDCHIFSQLFHTNDDCTVSVYNCLIGSDDPADPINSEFGIKDDARGYVFDSDLSNSDIVLDGTSILELTNCVYDSSRVYISGSGQLIVN